MCMQHKHFFCSLCFPDQKKPQRLIVLGKRGGKEGGEGREGGRKGGREGGRDREAKRETKERLAGMENDGLKGVGKRECTMIVHVHTQAHTNTYTESVGVYWYTHTHTHTHSFDKHTYEVDLKNREGHTGSWV